MHRSMILRVDWLPASLRLHTDQSDSQKYQDDAGPLRAFEFVAQENRGEHDRYRTVQRRQYTRDRDLFMFERQIIGDERGRVHDADSGDKPERGAARRFRALTQRDGKQGEHGKGGDADHPYGCGAGEDRHHVKSEDPEKEPESYRGRKRPGNSAENMPSMIFSGGFRRRRSK